MLKNKMLNLLGGPSATPKFTFKISVVIEPDEGGFHAYCPALKGLHVNGKTQEEALENTKEAILVYFVSLAKHGDPLPIGPDLMLERGEPEFDIPKGALLQNLTLQWPSPQMSGIR